MKIIVKNEVEQEERASLGGANIKKSYETNIDHILGFTRLSFRAI